MDFTQPSLGIDHGGDFLLELFHSSFSTSIDRKPTLVTGQLNSNYGRMPHMLLHDIEDASEFKGYDPNRGVNRDSISYLLQLARDIKQDPVRLTRLLIQMAKADLEYALEFSNPLCIVDLGNLVEVVKKYCVGNDGISHIKYSPDLALILTKWRDNLEENWGRFSEVPEYAIREMIEPEELTKRCTQVIHGLMNPKVMRFGLWAARSIACARPVVAADAAAGWLRESL
jgi:hypothetical protein